MTHSEALHHSHKRKRIYSLKEKYPHPNKKIRILDNIIYIVGIAGPLMTIPQLVKILVEKNAAGISEITWIAYILFASIWLAYGIVHKEKPIIITNILWILIEIAIVIAAFVY